MTHLAAKILVALAFCIVGFGGCWLLAKMDVEDELIDRKQEHEKNV